MAPRSEDPKLIILVINFELVQPICSRYVNVTDRQTDGRTDGRTTYDSNTALALRASRGKNFNEDRPILSAERCREMTLVSGIYIRFIWIFAEVPWRRGVINDSGVIENIDFQCFQTLRLRNLQK